MDNLKSVSENIVNDTVSKMIEEFIEIIGKIPSPEISKNEAFDELINASKNDQIRLEKIAFLADKYKITIPQNEAFMLFILSIPNSLNIEIEKSENLRKYIELAELLLVLSKTIRCNGNLKITAQLKALNEVALLSNMDTLSTIQKWADKRLSIRRSTIYTQRLGLPPKEYLEQHTNNEISQKDKNADKNANRLYTEKELEQIIDYEKSIIDEVRRKVEIRKLSFCLTILVNNYKTLGIFSQDTRYVKSNEASFLYDVLLLFDIIQPERDMQGEIVESTLTAQDKFQKIKDYLRTAERK